jgi:hypothetical protein
MTKQKTIEQNNFDGKYYSAGVENKQNKTNPNIFEQFKDIPFQNVFDGFKDIPFQSVSVQKAQSPKKGTDAISKLFSDYFKEIEKKGFTDQINNNIKNIEKPKLEFQPTYYVTDDILNQEETDLLGND